MTDSRLAEGPHFTRRAADAEIRAQLSNWEIWECKEPDFSYTYDQSVTLHVNQGAATLAFSDGSSVDLLQGDVLTIRKGISADWTIPDGIQNSYELHND
ncbi:hypothetical protein RA19_18480 [Leisingera sp. ANG-M1]|uniref:cupin domain-containing protein n=1 Tax=Leisingera sp. ANG-M1 TaxID=1577895 RepID=UPI00057F232E|nr:cupin domain-containing protein [Leisingera sp. ANG-M1]KIC08845.1 hypothetical protein RA19_18480 [Leisingera sp. ANG-M1]